VFRPFSNPDSGEPIRATEKVGTLQTNQPNDFEPTLFHGLLDRYVNPLDCSICKI